jgi:hypothetical protein
MTHTGFPESGLLNGNGYRKTKKLAGRFSLQAQIKA